MQNIGHDAEHLITSPVSVYIVELLEQINIQQSKGSCGDWASRMPAFEAGIKGSTIGDLRQSICLSTTLS